VDFVASWRPLSAILLQKVTNMVFFCLKQRKSERTSSLTLKSLSIKGKSDKETSFLKAAAAGKVEKVQASIKARKVRRITSLMRA
jgi:hypothetical protein